MSSQVLETLLTLNRAYQEAIHEKLTKLNQLIEENQARQNHISNLINESTDIKNNESKLEIVLTKLKDDYLKYKFSAGPPLTKDILRKKKLVIYDDIPKFKAKWEKSEKKKLEKAIIDDMVKHMKAPFLNRLIIYREKLKKAKVIGDDIKIIQFESLINDAENELNKIDHMTDKEILSKVDVEKVDWLKISNKSLEERRSANDCKFVWMNVFQPFVNQKTWTLDEKKVIIELARKNKEKNWEKIAIELNTGRSAYLCMKWYHEETVERFTKRDWSEDETNELIGLAQTYKIGSYVPYNFLSYLNGKRDRHSVYCWYLRVNPNINRGKWSLEEELALMEALKYYNNTYNWKEISEYVETRNPNQCREKFDLKFLKPGKYVKWSVEEDAKLLELHKKHDGSWVKIARELDNRNDHACLMRYSKLTSLQEQNKWLEMQTNEVKEFIEFACKNVNKPSLSSCDSINYLETPNRVKLSINLLSGVATKIKENQDLIKEFIEQKRQGKLNIRILDTIGIKTPVIDALMRQAQQRQHIVEKAIENEVKQRIDKENKQKEMEEKKKLSKKREVSQEEKVEKVKKKKTETKKQENEKASNKSEIKSQPNKPSPLPLQHQQNQEQRVGPKVINIVFESIDENYKIPCIEEKSIGFKFLYSLKKNSDPKYLEKFFLLKCNDRVIALKPIGKYIDQNYLTQDKCKKIDEILKKVCI